MFLLVASFLSIPAFCQSSSADEPAPQPESKRIFWIVPNFRTAPLPSPWKPLTAKEKFAIATRDSFDRGTVALGLLFGGEGMLTDSNPSFGQGAKGFGHYFATSYTDFVVGDYMTEAVFPVLLHQDPRFFRKGHGGAVARIGHATGQVFWTHADSGRGEFNYSEIAGNSAAVAISMAYYPENRDVKDGISKLGSQVGVDMVSNLLKEFFPDLQRKMARKRAAKSAD
jgi:hypothetical protein